MSYSPEDEVDFPRDPVRPSDPLIGQDLADYHIDQYLGHGAMGTVYLAHHHGLDRFVALKILRPDRAETDRDYLRRFREEGRVAAKLVHSHIVTVHALGDAPSPVDGRPLHYLEMEYVAGQSLEHFIDREARSQLSPVLAAGTAQRIAEGLGHAHDEGIVHRDVKPENVLMSLENVPKIADFGLCKRIEVAAEGGARSLTGTPAYMAPELYRGEPATPASDVYALGVSLYRMLAGKLPFAADHIGALIHAIAFDTPVPLRDLRDDIPLELAECVAALMDKSPANRPANGRAAAAYLRALVGKARDLQTLIRDAFAHDSRVKWTGTGSHYQVDVALPRGRKQRVFVDELAGERAEALLRISSRCGIARPDLYELALRLNGEMEHGGVSLREVEGALWFEVTDTYPRMTVDAEEIRHSAHEVAARADSLELLLSEVDLH